jgi:hypothetical protein
MEASPLAANEFQRGLIYTVDPRIIGSLAPREEYRIVASSRFLVTKDEEFTGYESLYRRARQLIDSRKEELVCGAAAAALDTWIASHGWFRMEISQGALVGAVITLGIECLAADDVPGRGVSGAGRRERRGCDDPTPAALRAPYVAELGPRGSGRAWFDEFYNDFDMRNDRSDACDVTISYGEYAPSPDTIDAAELVGRAEARARAYLHAVGGDEDQLRLIRRDWNCLATGKSAKPFLAHVTLLFGSAL